MHARRLTACCGLLAAVLGVFAQPVEVTGANAASGAVAPSAPGSGRLGIDDRRDATVGVARGPQDVASAVESNFWPGVVRAAHPGANTSDWTAAGPLLFGRTTDDGGRTGGLRPLWIQESDARGAFRQGYFLYPVFSYRIDGNTYQWNVLELIRRTDRRAGAPAPRSGYAARGDFEIWPFWFSRDTGDPALSYRGLFPVAGTIKNKLGFDRATWLAFPLYTQTEKHGVVTTSLPWPFVRVTGGAAHGFGLWPLFEYRDRPGMWRQEYYLWPLGYNHTVYPAPDAPPGTPPTRDVGALPFYARRTAPGFIDECFLWPFFGYTDRTAPTRYHETRYFWPFLVQGRGDDHYVNRWGPLYTHSVIKGYDKTWLAWPVIRHAEWTDRGLALRKTQVLYFLFWNEQQRRANRPDGPAASLTHLWPLYSAWKNGAGGEQFQLFSPFEVFFPGNDKVRNAWSPLVAIARREQTAPGESRTSLLWNAVTWRRDDAHARREFHLGPLVSVARQAATRRIALGHGLLAFRRDADAHWHIRWFDFHSSRSANPPR